MKILMDHGANAEQAMNGAYQYIHHFESLVLSRRGSQDEYDEILDRFRAPDRRPIDCVRHLEQMGFTFGQAKTAVHRYRSSRRLIR